MRNEVYEFYYKESEMAAIMEISVNTLRDRRSRGTDHPPYVTIRRGVNVYPKDQFLEWLRSRKLTYEVRSSA